MKLKPQQVKLPPLIAKQSARAKVVKDPRGRPMTIGGKRCNFYCGDDLRDAIVDTQARLKKQGINKPKLTLSYVLRTGGWMLLDSVNADLDKATRGELHAKKRVVKTLRPEATKSK